MPARLKAGLAACVLAITALACANPFGPTQAPAPAGVETIVALTFEALTSAAPGAPPTAPGRTLPGSLFFLTAGSTEPTQVGRVEPDGITIRTITAEPEGVTDYAVSPVDGSVAYVSGNKLLLVDVNGVGRRVLVDGGPLDPNNPFLNSIWSPAFSRDGRIIAYGHGGLNFYSLATGVSNRVIENKIRNIGDMPFPDELYWPATYSPDGTRLLVTLGYYEGSSSAIYDLTSGNLTRLTGDAVHDVCCNAVWSADGSALYAALPTVGMFSPGMWRIDPATGAVTTLIKGFLGDGNYNLAGYPHLASDGQLYFFYAENKPEGEILSRPPLQMVRAAADGVTGRTVLRPEVLSKMNEALWSPDATFVVAAIATSDDVYQGGRLELYYVDGRPPVPIAFFGRELSWGP